MLVALAIGPTTTAIDWEHLKSLGPIQGLVMIKMFSLLLQCLFIWKASQGENWARISLLVIFLVSIPYHFFNLRAEVDRSIMLAFLSVAHALLQGAGLLVTFQAPAKHWFKNPANVLNS